MRRLWFWLFGKKAGLSTSEALYALWLGYRVRKTTWRAGVCVSKSGRFLLLYVSGGFPLKAWNPYASDFSPRARWEVLP